MKLLAAILTAFIIGAIFVLIRWTFIPDNSPAHGVYWIVILGVLAFLLLAVRRPRL